MSFTINKTPSKDSYFLLVSYRSDYHPLNQKPKRPTDHDQPHSDPTDDHHPVWGLRESQYVSPSRTQSETGKDEQSSFVFGVRNSVGVLRKREKKPQFLFKKKFLSYNSKNSVQVLIFF